MRIHRRGYRLQACLGLVALACAGLVSPSLPSSAATTTTVQSSPDLAGAASAAETQHSRVEVSSLDDAHSTTFVNPDGTLTTETSVAPLRVRRGGVWVPVDYTLIHGADAWVPKASPVPVAFSDGGDRDAAALGSGTKLVQMAWDVTLPQPTVDDATATYDLGGGESLLLTATASGFEQSLVLARPPATLPRMKLPFATSGLTVSPDGTGGYVFAGPEGQPVYQLAPPVMYGSRDDPSTGLPQQQPVATSVVETSAGARLDLTPSMAWLSDPGTAYPVTIDPFVAQPTESEDTYVQSTIALPSEHSTILHVGMYGLGGSIPARAYLRFDGMSAFAGTTILNATLKLWNNNASSCTVAHPFNIYALTQSFDSSTIWNNKPTSWTTDGASTGNFAYGATGCASNFGSSDVTQMVSAWAAGTIPNDGLQLMGAAETNGYPHWDFCSMDYAAGAGDCNTSSHAPALTVTWLPPPPNPIDSNTLCATPAADECTPTQTQDAWTATPDLTARTTDPLGLDLTYTFELWASDGTNPVGSSPVASGALGNVLSGAIASFTTPALSDAATYQYRVKVSNGLTATLWSAWHFFTTTVCDVLQALPDSTAADPVTSAAVRVLNWQFNDLVVSQYLPPVGFDAATATDDQLAFYGLPEPPADTSDQEAMDAWQAEVASPEVSDMQPIASDGMCALPIASGNSTDAVPDSDPADVDPADATATPYTSDNWAGEVGTAHSNYTYVTGEINIPSFTQCANSNPDSHLTWVGIGGNSSGTNLIQNGVGSGASSIYGDALHPYAWWETLSNNRPSTNHLIALTQSVVPTNVGDDIVFSTQYIASQHRVKFYWHNKTRHFARTITVTGTLDNTSSTETTPGHIAGYYTGNTAEAIDERAGTSDGHYYQNRQHGVTHWINVRVSNSSPTSSVAIRSQAHHGVIMTNVARTLHLDTPTAVSGYLTRFNSTWNHCGPYEAIP